MPALFHEPVFINILYENVLNVQSVQSQTVQLQVAISIQSEQIVLDIPREDGDSVRVWVRATDVMGNTKTDSVLVHVVPDTKTSLPDTEASLPLAAIAGGSAAGVAVIASVTVAVICCLILKSRKR